MNKKLEHDLNKEKGGVGKMITLFCNSPFIHFLFTSCFPEISAASFCMHCVLPLEPQLLFYNRCQNSKLSEHILFYQLMSIAFWRLIHNTYV